MLSKWQCPDQVRVNNLLVLLATSPLALAKQLQAIVSSKEVTRRRSMRSRRKPCQLGHEVIPQRFSPVIKRRPSHTHFPPSPNASSCTVSVRGSLACEARLRLLILFCTWDLTVHVFSGHCPCCTKSPRPVDLFQISDFGSNPVGYWCSSTQVPSSTLCMHVGYLMGCCLCFSSSLRAHYHSSVGRALCVCYCELNILCFSRDPQECWFALPVLPRDQPCESWMVTQQQECYKYLLGHSLQSLMRLSPASYHDIRCPSGRLP